MRKAPWIVLKEARWEGSVCVVDMLQCGQCQNLSDNESRMGEQCRMAGTDPEGWTEDVSVMRCICLFPSNVD